MFKYLAVAVAIFALTQSATSVDDLNSTLDMYTETIDSIRSEQLKRGIEIIVGKKTLAKEARGEEGVKCVELHGNKYLQRIEENNVNSTEEINKKIKNLKESLKNGQASQVEEAINKLLNKEVESVLTNLQAKGESITLEYVRVANQCRGV